jgi:HKD family nuclease
VRTELVATWPDNRLLPAIRTALREADEALLCVAFVNRRGINLLEPQLSALSRRCRLLVTTVFGGTTSNALTKATDMGIQVRVLNPPGGTFHPKLYLTRSPNTATAVIGSANLTSGLVANIETSLAITGTPREQPLADSWHLAETLWTHPAAVDWTPTGIPIDDEHLDEDLLRLLRQAIPNGTTVPTLNQGRPNTVIDITPHGVYLHTLRSQTRQSGPQLLPAWMLQLAWDYLQQHRTLTNRHLLATDGLNIKRSSAVCALLARLPRIDVTSTSPITLQLRESA